MLLLLNKCPFIHCKFIKISDLPKLLQKLNWCTGILFLVYSSVFNAPITEQVSFYSLHQSLSKLSWCNNNITTSCIIELAHSVDVCLLSFFGPHHTEHVCCTFAAQTCKILVWQYDLQILFSSFETITSKIAQVKFSAAFPILPVKQKHIPF